MEIETIEKEKDLLMHLISLRSNTEIVPTYGADIPLETKEFKSDNFSTDENRKFNEIVETLEKIKKDDLDIEGYTTIKEIKRQKTKKIITIEGASTVKLRRYILKRLIVGKSFFGIARHNNNDVLTFMDDKTRIRINKEQSAILKYLTKYHGQYVSYKSLIGILKPIITHGDKYFEQYTDNESRGTYFISNNYIRPLRDKLNKASKNICKQSKFNIIVNGRSSKESNDPGSYKLQI